MGKRRKRADYLRECSMQEAREERPMDLRESVRVLQVTGFFPSPLNQRLKSSVVISVVFLLHSNVMVGMMDPSLSCSNRIPNIS